VSEGPEGEGAPNESSPGEGPQGEGPQGEGPQGEGPEGQGTNNEPLEENPPTPPDDIEAGSDGTLPDRNSDDINDSDDDDDEGVDEVLPLATYQSKGQQFYNAMMAAVHQNPRRNVQYSNYNIRYRIRTEQRNPLGPDPEESGNPDETGNMAAVLWISGVATRPEIGIDLTAPDWTYMQLTNRARPVPEQGDLDPEGKSAIATYVSKSQKTILVTFSNSKNLDPDIPGTQKLPNSEKIFQILQGQFGDSVADTRFIIRHPLVQKGSISVITGAHLSRGIDLWDMATWTPADGDIWFQLLGTRNGRPTAFMLTDHPDEMHCKTVVKIYTWARSPGSLPLGFPKSTMVMELGNDVETC
jgi:hypothetical protein